MREANNEELGDAQDSSPIDGALQFVRKIFDLVDNNQLLRSINKLQIIARVDDDQVASLESFVGRKRFSRRLVVIEVLFENDRTLNFKGALCTREVVRIRDLEIDFVLHMNIFYCQSLKIVARTREEYRKTKLNHWVDFVRNNLTFHEIDDEHYIIIESNHVLKFQQTLKKTLVAREL